MGDVLCILKPLLSVALKFISKVKCPNQLYGITIPRFAGKSSLIQSVESNDFYLVDLEALVQLSMTDQEREQLQKLQAQNAKNYSLHYQPLARKYLNNLRKEHKQKKFLIFASDLDLLKYCNVKVITSYVPSNQLATSITEHLPDAESARIFATSRLDIMLAAKKQTLTAYNSFDDLAKHISGIYKLQMRL